MLNPITFSIPEEKIVNFTILKKRILSELIPGNLNTYVYENEEDYYNQYRESFFAVTTKKAGWDCVRHYEILANGCIPYFPNIEECPENILALLPKDLLIEGNNLFKKFMDKFIFELTDDDIRQYSILNNKLLTYVRNNLTTKKIAKYILTKTHFENISNILYLSADPHPDYLRCLTLHGFKELFGSNCHDYPKVPHIYKSDTINFKKLYGKGFTYSNLLEPVLHNDIFDETIFDDIKKKKYDIIIYGSYHRGMPFYDLVSNIYKPNEIILLCGQDTNCIVTGKKNHFCDYKYWLQKGNNVFVRELE
jgi:hypothetical protein